jgi:hypothetical protein
MISSSENVAKVWLQDEEDDQEEEEEGGERSLSLCPPLGTRPSSVQPTLALKTQGDCITLC